MLTGEGLDDGDYISMTMHGRFGRIEQGLTRNEIHENNANRQQGFETQEIDEGEDLISV